MAPPTADFLRAPLLVILVFCICNLVRIFSYILFYLCQLRPFYWEFNSISSEDPESLGEGKALRAVVRMAERSPGRSCSL